MGPGFDFYPSPSQVNLSHNTRHILPVVTNLELLFVFSPHLNEGEISGLPGASVMGGASVAPQPLVPAATLPPGFGDALTAALDVMAFAQDIDPSGVSEGITSTEGYLISDGHQSKGLPMTITESSISPPTTVIEMGINKTSYAIDCPTS